MATPDDNAFAGAGDPFAGIGVRLSQGVRTLRDNGTLTGLEEQMLLAGMEIVFASLCDTPRAAPMFDLLAANANRRIAAAARSVADALRTDLGSHLLMPDLLLDKLGKRVGRFETVCLLGVLALVAAEVVRPDGDHDTADALEGISRKHFVHARDEFNALVSDHLDAHAARNRVN